VLAHRGSVDDVSDSAVSHKDSQKTEQFKMSHFHFSVRLFLSDDIFTKIENGRATKSSMYSGITSIVRSRRDV